MSRPIINIEVDKRSVQRTLRSMRKINKDVNDKLIKMLEETAAMIVNDTVSPHDFPVITGTLRGSYQPDKQVDKSRMSIEVGSVIDYAPVVEQRKPFFFPAVEKHAERFNRAIEKLIEKEI